MNIDLLPLISFVVITTFTPGPNNISSASMGIVYGYKRTLNYLMGISMGFFLIMIACAFLSSTLLAIIPAAEKYLRWVGGLYILWLAVGILKTNYTFSETNNAPKAFLKGLILQVVNPKAIVYGLTLYATFLAPISRHPYLLAVFALIFALVAFAATTFWALCGAAIKNNLKNQSFTRILNTALSLLLIYTAIDLSGVLTFLL